MLDKTYDMVMFWTLVYYLSGGFAFKESGWKLWKSKALVALIICLALGLSMDYAASKENTPKDELSHWIEPYPNISEFIFAAPFIKTAKRIWMFKSPHRPYQVLMYYDDPKFLRDWTLSYSDPKTRSFARGGLRMDITASKYLKGSAVMYTLRKVGP